MHQSGISVSETLKQAFNAARDGNTLFLKYQIKDEEFVQIGTGDKTASADEDFKAAAAVLEPKTPCYLVMRTADGWVLISYVPGNSMVRDKMVYASSRSSLKDGLGSNHFKGDYFITEKSECTVKGYEMSKKQEVTMDHLTYDEQLKIESKQASAMAQANVKTAAIADLPIKLTDGAVKAVESFKNKEVNCVFFNLDPDKEIVELAGNGATGNYEADELAAKLPPKDPMFVLYNYKYESESKESLNSLVFVYYCPDKAQRKAKMIFSASKRVLVSAFEGLGVAVQKNLEISESKELDAKALEELVNPKQAQKKAFAKPKKPGKGPARLHKSDNAEQQ